MKHPSMLEWQNLQLNNLAGRLSEDLYSSIYRELAALIDIGLNQCLLLSSSSK